MRDLYYQSPYLRRFTSNRLGFLSGEKDSLNKENISPLSGTPWPNGHHLKSGSTHSGNTPLHGALLSANRLRSPILGGIAAGTQDPFERQMDIDDPFKSSPEEELKTPAGEHDMTAPIHDFEQDLNN